MMEEGLTMDDIEVYSLTGEQIADTRINIALMEDGEGKVMITVMPEGTVTEVSTETYEFNGVQYPKRPLGDQNDCDSSIECQSGLLCLNDAGEEENQVSNDPLYPHEGLTMKDLTVHVGHEICRMPTSEIAN